MALLWQQMRLRQRFMLVVGATMVLVATVVVLIIARYEEDAAIRKLQQLSVNEITSLHAFIVNVMSKRPDDADNIGVTVFNNWFDSRNKDYPGKVWSVWGPKVTNFMHETEPDRAAKTVRDEVDREALETGKPVSRLVGGYYRYSLPIVLGVTEGAKAEVCHTCHTAMGME